LLKSFYDPSPCILNPCELVTTFTKKTQEDLKLPKRAVIVFSVGDLRHLLGRLKHNIVHAWSGFRSIYKIEGKETIVTKSAFGGPNIAALVEELACFGVEEIFVWGYCGGIKDGLNLGDIIAVEGALREDGVSYHYLGDNEDDIVWTTWLGYLDNELKGYDFIKGIIWSCDAIYRETEEKINSYRKRGIQAVEMEVASFYSVCRYRDIKGIAFVVVSDLLTDKKWIGGFHDESFKKGAKRLLEFIIEKVIS